MVNGPLNDNNSIATSSELRGPDAHGQAAMLLVESLIHGLIERSIITVADAVEIVESAADVKEEVASDLGDSPANLRKSLIILGSLVESLNHDIK
jgi:hypothetical protein